MTPEPAGATKNSVPLRRGSHVLGFDFEEVDDAGEYLPDLDPDRADASRFRIDAKRIFLLGNSSGGHLAGMLMGAGEAPLARGALLVSGIYDLEPVRLSSRNEYLQLDPATARSPSERMPSGGRPLIVGWGEGELDEFQRQSREFAAAWSESGGAVRTVIRPECATTSI